MKVLIIGNGGREHAIGIKLKQDNASVELFFAKGNGGTENIGININLSLVSELLQFALSNKIDVTIVGSEALLVEGIVDVFEQNNLQIFGPNKTAAMLEGDKAFAKIFMNKYGVRTALHKAFYSFDDAIKYVVNQSFPIVIKATGLAGGKGVFIAQNFEEAQQNIQQILVNRIFGDAGNEIVIEEFLQGFEVSVLSIFNKKNIFPLISAKDHKKIFDNDKGANTGGMGAIAPNPLYTKNIEKDFNENILEPTLKGLLAEGLTFAGIIFFGLMVINNECYLLEYNLRMGDPETQAILPLLNSNFIDIVSNAIAEKNIFLDWKNEHSCCVVLASNGYPNKYEVNKKIDGIESYDEQVVIAGANKINNKYYTSGGRVLNIIATATTLEIAKTKAYQTIDNINFEGKYWRTDIGKI